MSPDNKDLTTNELAVLESLLWAPKAISQREIAKRTGLSVGLINAVIKRLALTGYVKTTQLNHRSINYLLTPDGFAQTALKSYRYVMSTVQNYREIQKRLLEVVGKLVSEGVSEFYLHGEGELADLVAVFIQEDGKVKMNRGLPEDGRKRVVVLNAAPQVLSTKKWRVIELVHELGNGGRNLMNREM